MTGLKLKTGAGTYLFAVTAILLWGMSYIWSDQLLRKGIPVEYFVLVRIFAAALILLLFNLLLKLDLRIKSRRDGALFVLLSAFEPFIYFICETYGIKLTESPTYSALIVASTPIFSVLFAFFFLREKMTLLNVIGIIVCLAGIVLVTISASTTGKYFTLGVILLLVAVFSEVGHATCVKSLGVKGYHPAVIVMYQFFIGSLMMLPLFLTRGLRDFEPSLYLSWEVFKPILSLALFCSSMAFSLWAACIKALGVAKSSIFLAMIPAVTALAGFILGQEILTSMQWLGIAVATFGVVLTQLNISLGAGKRGGASLRS